MLLGMRSWELPEISDLFSNLPQKNYPASKQFHQMKHEDLNLMPVWLSHVSLRCTTGRMDKVILV